MGSLAVAVPDTCDHNVFSWRNCQRCGRPQCKECVLEEGVTLARCSIAIPLHMCTECRDLFLRLDNTVPGRSDGSIKCSTHAQSPAAVAGCAACTSALDTIRRLRIDTVLSVVNDTKWYGAGGRRTNAGKAGMAALAAVPMMALSTVGGALGGLASGALSGALGGAVMAGAFGLDAGNAMGKARSKAIEAGKAGKAPAKPPAPAPAPPASEAEAPPSTPAVVNERTAGIMAKAKLIMRMSPEEQEADAVAEVARIAACKTAYEVLEIHPSASKEEVNKAHKAKSMAYHPDKNSAVKAKDAAQAANNAYTLLSDAEKRAKYDASGFSDTSGVDLGEGVSVNIGTSRGAVAAGAAAGVLGGLFGLGAGAAAGVLGGALSGMAGALSRARDMSMDTIRADEVVGERVAARRSALGKEGAKGGPGSASSVLQSPPPSVTVQAGEGVMLSIPRAAFGGVLKGQTEGPSPSLSLSEFTLPDLQAGLEFIPGPRFLEQYSRLAGQGAGDRVFARRYASAMGAVCAFKRKQLGVPEPKAEGEGEGEGSSQDHGPDATGMHGGDLYEDREKNSTQINSAGGLLNHMSKEMGKEVSGMFTVQEAQLWALLAAQYEACSRGRAPVEGWLEGRVKGILGAGEEEGEGEEGEEGQANKKAEAEAKAAAEQKDASKAKTKDSGKVKVKAIVEPDRGWPADAPAATLAPLYGPFVTVDVAVVPPVTRAAPTPVPPSSFFTRSSSSPASEVGGALRWFTVSCTPVALLEAQGDAAVQLRSQGLPPSLLSEAQGSVPASAVVRLRWRVYLSAGATRVNAPAAGPTRVMAVYGAHVTETEVEKQVLVGLAGK